MTTTQCAVLVGGLGTRLGKLTATKPKPLLHVGSRPFLDYLVDEIARQGFDDIICLAGYRADEVREWSERRTSGPKIKISVEPKPWGTAGALLAAKDLLQDEFLLLNGDSTFDINLVDLAAWQPSGVWQGIVAIRSMADAGRYACVELRGDTISEFAERPALDGRALINAGIYRLKRGVLDLVKSVPCSIERDIFPLLTAQGLLRGRLYDRFFIDIGIPSALEDAQTLVPAMAMRPALIMDRDGVVNKDVGYAFRAEQIEWVDGIFDVVKEANDKGLYVFVVTNQAGVARGLYDEDAVRSLHAWMNQQFRARGAHIDDFAYCPHHPTEGHGHYRQVCNCRKPGPGMILDLAQRWPIDLARSILVGDKDSDLQAARNAGIAGILYESGPIRGTLRKWLNKSVPSSLTSGLQGNTMPVASGHHNSS